MRLRITGIGQISRESDGAWLSLRGVEIRNQLEIGERIVPVRFSVLAAAKRAAAAGGTKA